MNAAEAESKMISLREELERYNAAYYEQDDPLVSDATYDQKMRELRELEETFPQYKRDDSPTQKVGGRAGKQFQKVEHHVQMMSLQDVFSFEEVETFCRKCEETCGDTVRYIVEPKIDGLSVSLEYREGKFVRGSTRGDGYVGEDVTEHLRTIRNLPQQLTNAPEFLEVRGEVYLSRERFRALVQKQIENGEAPAKNPRNAAAGSLRQKNAAVTAERGLDIWIFNVQQISGKTLTHHAESLDYLTSLGFSTVIPHSAPCATIAEVRKEIELIGEARFHYAYDTDGAVVKVDDFSQRAALGATSKVPKWASAFKFPPEEKETTLQEITLSVGRTGVITPVAQFTPILLAGTSVARASMHNQDFITQRDIRVGDTIFVRKAGEIIPEVVCSLTHQPDSVPYLLPKICPSCGAETHRDPDGAALRCENPACPVQLQKRLEHFVSKDAMNIDGLGPQILEKLVTHDVVHTVADLYDVTQAQLCSLEKIAEKLAENIWTAIQASKKNPLHRLIYALGIRGVGGNIAKRLCAKFSTMDALLAATQDDFAAVDGIGPILATNLAQSFSDPQMRELIAKLKAAGCTMTETTSEGSPRDTRFSGMTFVFTGTLQTMKRDVATASVQQYGGKVVGAVSKNTSCVVAGESPGSKLQKAETLGIPIWTEDEFLAKLEEGYNSNEN